MTKKRLGGQGAMEVGKNRTTAMLYTTVVKRV